MKEVKTGDSQQRLTLYEVKDLDMFHYGFPPLSRESGWPRDDTDHVPRDSRDDVIWRPPGGRTEGQHTSTPFCYQSLGNGKSHHGGNASEVATEIEGRTPLYHSLPSYTPNHAPKTRRARSKYTPLNDSIATKPTRFVGRDRYKRNKDMLSFSYQTFNNEEYSSDSASVDSGTKSQSSGVGLTYNQLKTSDTPRIAQWLNGFNLQSTNVNVLNGKKSQIVDDRKAELDACEDTSTLSSCPNISDNGVQYSSLNRDSTTMPLTELDDTFDEDEYNGLNTNRSPRFPAHQAALTCNSSTGSSTTRVTTALVPSGIDPKVTSAAQLHSLHRPRDRKVLFAFLVVLAVTVAFSVAVGLAWMFTKGRYE